LCLVLGMLLANLPGVQGRLTPVATAILFVGFGVSIVVDIVLAIKWGDSIAKKLIFIFLMPTNYTFLIIVLYSFWLVGQWIEILNNLPPNFG